tara:strand:+ start:145 stop:255 length:111 start_codon:yes stop_codon:yes gene_type:complete
MKRPKIPKKFNMANYLQYRREMIEFQRKMMIKQGGK